ncbi:hypothetical protein D9758_008595 [Tetrapyrgos nigripes]|uniref:Uncharacterized protein n=1 Tax=Tetrapyrgos nigripes TaxID=182062 RepID=A0A8H5G5K9_9AGAR|nr:hypothetical protein D9758_008595 [Tetrapyrgos nigripes]
MLRMKRTCYTALMALATLRPRATLHSMVVSLLSPGVSSTMVHEAIKNVAGRERKKAELRTDDEVHGSLGNRDIDVRPPSDMHYHLSSLALPTGTELWHLFSSAQSLGQFWK